MAGHTKLLVVDVAALGWDLVQRHPPGDPRLAFQGLETVFPAVTCPVQAAFRTALSPLACGLESNGIFQRALRKVSFWEQSAFLIHGARIWQDFRARGRKVGVFFWQQSLGEAADLILSPKPVHQHHGGLIQDCYSQPHDLYARLSAKLERPFNLMHYWGPLASPKSSDWIVEATCAVLAAPDLAPNLLLTYLPHLDYDLQRYGPDDACALRSLDAAYALLSRLWQAADAAGYDIVIFGDYAIEKVSSPPIFPNLALQMAGLFRVRTVAGRVYPDFFTSAAFALVDHQVAQILVLDAARRVEVRRAMELLDGVDQISERDGALLIAAKPGRWFAYPWWTAKRAAPDFAGHVDIHSKPGYDPCELLFGWPPGSISQAAARIRGTHGLAGPDRKVAWASSLSFANPVTLLDLAQQMMGKLSAL